MILGDFKGRQAYGIEVERQDIIDGELVKIERDSVNYISTHKERLRNYLI